MFRDFFQNEAKVMVVAIIMKAKGNFPNYYWHSTNALTHLYSVFLKALYD